MKTGDAMNIPTFEKFEKNEEWFSKNVRKIEKKYRDKFLAVTAPGKIMVDEDIDKLLKRVEKNKNINSALIVAIPPKGVASIV